MTDEALSNMVKPLIWEAEQYAEFYADSVVGRYHIHGNFELGYCVLCHGTNINRSCNTEAEAQAAAQADYERRILSALSPAHIERAREMEAEKVTVPPLRKYDYCEPRKFLLLASYCGGDTPGCTENDPCINCIRMCNAYDAEGKYAGTIKCVNSSEGDPEEMTAFKSWLRQWVKDRFGKWITYNSASIAYRDFSEARTALLPKTMEDGDV